MVRICLFFLVVFFAHVAPGHAARTFTVSVTIGSGGIYNHPFNPPSCSYIQEKFSKSIYGEISCSGLDEAVKAVSRGGSRSFSVTSETRGAGTGSVSQSGGDCTAGANREVVSLPSAYKRDDGTVVQNLDQGFPTYSKAGCTMAADEVVDCFSVAVADAPGIRYHYCDVAYVEDGTNGGSEGKPSSEPPPYTGGGSSGGGGDGGTGGGGAGGGGSGGGG